LHSYSRWFCLRIPTRLVADDPNNPTGRNGGIQIDARGMLYVVCDISRTLLVVNPATRKVDATINVEGTGH